MGKFNISRTVPDSMRNGTNEVVTTVHKNGDMKSPILVGGGAPMIQVGGGAPMVQVGGGAPMFPSDK